MIPSDVFDLLYKLAVTMIGSAIFLITVKATIKTYGPYFFPFIRRAWTWFLAKALHDHIAEERLEHQRLEAAFRKRCKDEKSDL